MEGPPKRISITGLYAISWMDLNQSGLRLCVVEAAVVSQCRAFYYIIFGLLGYEFAKNTIFLQALLKSFINSFTKWVVGIHNYYVFLILFKFDLVWKLRINGLNFFLPFIIIRPEYDWGTEDSIFNLFLFQEEEELVCWSSQRYRFVFAWFKINIRFGIKFFSLFWCSHRWIFRW